MQKFTGLLDANVGSTVFWFCALIGTTLFILQFLLFFLGSGFQEDSSDLFDAGNFKVLSKQAVTGFLMMFGWVGITCLKEFNLSTGLATIAALCAGLFTFFVTGFVFKKAMALRSPGNIFRIEDCVGKEAIVYQRIPRHGTGKVTIALPNGTFEIDASTISGEDEIASFNRVKIISKIDDSTVVVRLIR